MSLALIQDITLKHVFPQLPAATEVFEAIFAEFRVLRDKMRREDADEFMPLHTLTRATRSAMLVSHR